MIEWTPEQSRKLQEPGPLRACDPETNETYVLVRAEVYERLKDILEEDVRQMEPLTTA